MKLYLCCGNKSGGWTAFDPRHFVLFHLNDHTPTRESALILIPTET